MIDPQGSAADWLAALDRGELTVAELMVAIAPATERTVALGGRLGPALDTSAFAEAADRRRADGRASPIEGLPISVKGNLGVEGLPTSAATQALEGHHVIEGGAVARLRTAGAVVTMRTNLHELAFGITGANAYSGDGLNPFDPAFLAGGSSSGAAISVATGAVAIALGTDTGGSCRVPAAHCGIVGFRPSLGRYPLDGCISLSPSRDTPGLFARCVGDVILADAIIAECPAAPPAGDIRLGVVRFGLLDPEVRAAFDASLEALCAAGISIEERDLSKAIEADEGCGFLIAIYESAQSLGSLARDVLHMDLMAFAATIASADVRALVASQAGPEAVSQAAYLEALETDLPLLRTAFDNALEGIDALIYPTSALPAPAADVGDTVLIDGVAIPTFPAYTMASRPDSMAGQPAISLPMGVTARGLPLGLQLCGARGNDAALLAIAKRVEAILPPRPRPSLA